MSLDFRSLLLALEDRLGTCHLLVNRNAKEPADVLLQTGVHDALAKELTRAIYKSNRCYHIKARVSEGATLAALGPVRARVLEDPRLDWATVRFLDDFHAAVRASFAQVRATTGNRSTRAPARPAEPAGARIFIFPSPLRNASGL